MKKFDNLKNGTLIKFDLDGVEKLGCIEGFSSELPIVGKLYIVNTSKVISKVYPYQSCIVPQSSIIEDLSKIKVKLKIK